MFIDPGMREKMEHALDSAREATSSRGRSRRTGGTGTWIAAVPIALIVLVLLFGRTGAIAGIVLAGLTFVGAVVVRLRAGNR